MLRRVLRCLTLQFFAVGTELLSFVLLLNGIEMIVIGTVGRRVAETNLMRR